MSDDSRIHAGDLKGIYFGALERCRPSQLVRRVIPSPHVAPSAPLRASDLGGGPVDVIAIGKCAAEMVRGVSGVRRCFAAVPRDYAASADFPEGAEVHFGTHPELSDASFAAGDALLRFVSECRAPVLVLLSGGSSACVELPLEPWFKRQDLIEANRVLLRAGLPIGQINTVRKHLSAIKGGRLGTTLPHRSVALILSDVDPDEPEMVGSGPTYADLTTNGEAATLLNHVGLRAIAEKFGQPDRDALSASGPPGYRPHAVRSYDCPETPEQSKVINVVVGDNRTLVEAAVSLAADAVPIDAQIEGDVDEAARFLFESARPGAVVVAGGEPTVPVRGDGRGGRCFELGARFAQLLIRKQSGDIVALFAGSDGRDGNSGAAGCVVSSERIRTSGIDDAAIRSAIENADTFRVAEKIGEPIIIPPTGNNLRDLFLIKRT